MKENTGKTLTRADLANAIIEEYCISRFDAAEIVEEILIGISLALANGENVKLAKFGTFIIHEKKERLGRNPKTMEAAIISSRRSISFRPSELFKEIVNNETLKK